MPKTSPLVLDAMIVTGNTKAAVKAAGGGSSDLWTVPPEQIHYDPRDNVRPLDQDRVRHIASLIKANGYDRKQPLGCFVRKVGSEDRIFVYAGQHRYHAALLAIKEGALIDRLPVVIDEAKSVNRTNLIYAGITTNDSEKLTPLQLAEKVVELQALGEPNATICKRLNITDQTIRDVLLLARAPAGLHKLVREKVVSSTLAIDEIRTHGGEKALERLQSAAAKAIAGGKAKVTKKALAKTASQKITEAHAKQLLRGLQAVLHDQSFGALLPSTIQAVHAALTPLADMLDAPTKKPLTAPDPLVPDDVVFVDGIHDPISYPLHTPNANGVFEHCERIAMPKPPKHRGLCPAEIMLAHANSGSWIFATSYALQKAGASSLPSINAHTVFHSSRFKAIQAARDQLIERLSRPDHRTDKLRPIIRKWLDDVYMAEHRKLRELAGGSAHFRQQTPPASKVASLSPQSAWPFPSGGRP
ncbi:ParB/RepB/Spo0J family partition protein [Paraburkholderia sp. D15]|uniref:ParB/RepB/Spo0J family partition protein n=1 Tax=Paraburkholderia sp. D15 TaxID=2880218 RepID=UPI00247905F7|nr:ParB/RepB/Spo0J family partition protein [Paraburkholderia sp. D15]WGS50829.1 ParB/RepB/Spo0J family partition protein [Paraburkholderia sp. D15]